MTCDWLDLWNRLTYWNLTGIFVPKGGPPRCIECGEPVYSDGRNGRCRRCCACVASEEG